MKDPLLRRLVHLVVFIGAFAFLAPATARAAVFVDFNTSGTLTISTDQGSSVTLNGVLGYVEVNSSPTAVLAADVLQLFVIGDSLPNQFFLQEVDPITGYTSIIYSEINSGGGDDFIIGTSYADLITGGPGADTVDMGPGDGNIFTWNPGDGSDVVFGGNDFDTVVVIGGGVDEQFSMEANGAEAILRRVSPGPFSVTTQFVERLALRSQGGDDALVYNDLTGTAVTVTGFDGGDGADTLQVTGTAGNDTFNGGLGVLTASFGGPLNMNVVSVENITADLGDGDDTANAGPMGLSGTTNVTLNGGIGANTLNLVGAVSAVTGDSIVASAVGADVYVELEFGGPTSKLLASNFAGALTILGNGGDDSIIVASLAGTAITAVTVTGGTGNDIIDASASSLPVTNIWNNGDNTDTFTGSGLGDIQVVNGAAAGDDFEIFEESGAAVFARLNLVPFTVTMNDVALLQVNSGDGNDSGTVTSLSATSLDRIEFTLGTGADRVDGLATDIPLHFFWSQGQGSDVVMGGSAFDTQFVTTVNQDETFTIANNGGMARLARTSSNPFTIDMKFVDEVNLDLRNGDDTVTASDVSGTGLTHVYFAGGRGDDSLNAGATSLICTSYWDRLDGNDVFIGGTTAMDLQIFNGDTQVDVLTMTASGASVILQRTNNPLGQSTASAVERFEVNSLANNDSLTVGNLAGTPAAHLTFTGGVGDDTLNASATAIDITSIWNNGDNTDVINFGTGNNLQVVNGAPAGDIFTVEANGAQTVFARLNLIPFTITISTSHTIQINSGAGNDSLTVQDLAGTGTTAVLHTAGPGDDTATVVASSATYFDLDGGPHVAGDTLKVITFGANFTELPGVINVDGAQSIIHANWENILVLEDFPSELWLIL